MATVGILALQGDFQEHQDMLKRLGAQTVVVKHSRDLENIDGLIIPGGESTAIAKLTEGALDPIFETIKSRIVSGMPVYGTCMGSIFLAKDIEGSGQGRLGMMNISVKRNAFGPQKFSREQTVAIPLLGEEPFPVVFIRAPIILSVGSNVKILGRVSEGIVMAQENNMLVSSFHPEITNDTRVHEYFLSMIKERNIAQTKELALSS